MTQSLFSEATRRDPQCWLAHLQMLSYLTRRWHGSDDAMYGFARSVSASAPPGSDLHTIVMAAHVERWIDLDHVVDDRKAAASYVANPAVRHECEAAYAQGLGSPLLRPRMSTQIARNWAATCFYLLRDKQRCHAELAIIGNGYTEIPWSQLTGNAEEGFHNAAKWAF